MPRHPPLALCSLKSQLLHEYWVTLISEDTSVNTVNVLPAGPICRPDDWQDVSIKIDARARYAVLKGLDSHAVAGGAPRKGAQGEANRVPVALPTYRGGASTSKMNSERGGVVPLSQNEREDVNLDLRVHIRKRMIIRRSRLTSRSGSKAPGLEGRRD